MRTAISALLVLSLSGSPVAADRPAAGRDVDRFSRIVVADLNRFWSARYRDAGYRGWRPAKLVLFNRVIRTACGPRSHRSGAIYCTTDNTVYVSRVGLRELAGDFAQALVIAHEMGHHAQLGLHITRRTARRSLRSSERERRRLKIHHELQADCFAGVWARDLERRRRLEVGDIAEAITALRGMGDDTLSVDRRRWKHGSAAHRIRWFFAGYRGGDIDACDTFDTRNPEEDP